MYELHSRNGRNRLRTSAGNVMVRWRRMRCKRCGGSRILLRDFLGLDRWQSKAGELEKMVAEVVREQSYRRSAALLDGIGMIPVPKSSAHRWEVESSCEEMKTAEPGFESLLADGTGYKRRPDPEGGKSNRGEIKLLLNCGEESVPLGAWSGQRWEEIAKKWEVQWNSQAQGPIAETLKV